MAADSVAVLREMRESAARAQANAGNAMQQEACARFASQVAALDAAIAALSAQGAEPVARVIFTNRTKPDVEWLIDTVKRDTLLYTTPQADEVDRLRAELDRLNAIINTPQSDDFLRAVSTEAEHQRQRWGTSHDGGKEPSDWFWLIGYLAGKALASHLGGNLEKAEHHIITTAAVCANWHRAMFGRTDMRPGIDGESAR